MLFLLQKALLNHNQSNKTGRSLNLTKVVMYLDTALCTTINCCSLESACQLVFINNTALSAKS